MKRVEAELVAVMKELVFMDMCLNWARTVTHDTTQQQTPPCVGSSIHNVKRLFLVTDQTLTVNICQTCCISCLSSHQQNELTPSEAG